MKAHWPLLGMFVSAALFVAAAAHYPGGTTASVHTVGYDWAHNFISSLFWPTALNGAANPARYFAIPAMLCLCISVGFVFWRISSRVESKVTRKTIEIAGIGSMVYAFLVVTPMHDLMVSIALLLFLVAMLAVLYVLARHRDRWLLTVGALCLALLLLTALVYYGNVFYDALPVLQKLSFVACAGWLFAVHYASRRLT